MANLKLFHVNKIYDGGVHAVKDFCLDVNDGEFVVFVGPSGCGKSTVLRMIAGLEKISTGDLFIGDRYVNSLPPKERNVSMVFQSYALFPNMSVYDNISYGLRMHGVDKAIIKEKVESVAEMLNLTDHLYKKPSALSGGQRQRVALGRSIVREPDVFLLDEPLSNLDAKLRNRMRSEIMALHDRLGSTFIYVTHDQVEAMTMGDKIVAMRDGEIMQTGSPSQLYRYPENVFVAGFIGTPQMNFWRGTLSLGDGNAKAACPFGELPLTNEQCLRLDMSRVREGMEIIIGLRPEDITVSRRHDSDIEIDVDVSVMEDFCAYAIYHGTSAGLDVVAQDKVDASLKGRTVKLYADVSALHLFDAETEKTILPIYAPSRTVAAVKQGSTLKILGGEIELPKWQSEAVADGEVRVNIPANAIGDGNIPVTCESVTETDEGPVSLLRCKGGALYANGDFSDKTRIGLLLPRLEISGQGRAEAIPNAFVLPFTYEKQGDKHYCVFGNRRAESYYDFNKKMYRLGKKAFKTEYKMHLTVNDVRRAREDECFPTVVGTVEKAFDYTNERYCAVSVGNELIYLRADASEGDEMTLALNLDGVRVSEAGSDIILF